GHADKMEVGIESVDLEGILDVVVCRAVTVIVGVIAGCGPSRCIGSCTSGWQRVATKDIRGGIARRAQVALLCIESGIKAGASRHTILPWTHIKLPDHAHLQVLGWRNVAVPEVCAGVWSQVVIGEA